MVGSGEDEESTVGDWEERREKREERREERDGIRLGDYREQREVL